MEGELWRQVYRMTQILGKAHRSRCVQYSNTIVVLVFIWAVLHDRPTSWACRQCNWPADQRWWPKPSPATMSRRLRRPAVAALLDALEKQCRLHFHDSAFRWLDGKPLPIGGCSKDPDAGYGRAASCKAKGYKIHCIWDAGGAVLAWEVQAIHVSEQSVAQRLIPQLTTPGFVIADGNYDANVLYELAGEHGQQLIAARRYRRAKGVGHQKHSLYRLRALRMIDDGVGPPLLKGRAGIERPFGAWGNFAGGLGQLPNWVRRLPRVRRWVQAKLILNACRMARNKGLAA